MGIIDRVIRVMLATAVGVLYFAGAINGIAVIILGAFSVIFLLTSTVAFCPLYLPLNISTCGNKEEKT